MPKKRFFSRATALRFVPFLLVVALLSQHYLALFSSEKWGLLSLAMDPRLFYAMAAILAVFAILTLFFPFEMYIHASFCLFWGALRIVDGELSEALAICALGCIFLYKRGFFALRRRPKIAFMALAFAAAVAAQARLEYVDMLACLQRLAELGIIALLIYFLLKPEFRIIAMDRRRLRLSLDMERFNDDDRRALQKILDGKKYEAIAIEENKSPVTFKRYVRKLFSKLEISGRDEFVSLYSGHTIYLGDEEQD
ncbi:MAG: hypothetical protein FWE09_08825 [Treponema sp.]|nr:hypothetical protein [Treponema sp.]